MTLITRRVLVGLAILVMAFVSHVAISFALMHYWAKRFEAIAPGTAAADVRREFGSPTSISQEEPSSSGVTLLNGCGNLDRECWFYLSQFRGDNFVCFNDAQRVTCAGRAAIWR
jgi:hypothetical protein